MGEHSYSVSAHGTSCALRHYPQQKRGKNDYDGLSRSQCLAAFQDWIANIRGECPDVSMKEKLMCPMLWCRANCFEDHDSLVQHTANCKHLSDTWYWCPYCTRPERFTGGGHWRGPIPGPAVKRTGSKIKAWLKDLGRKNTTKIYEAPASQPPKAADFSVLPFGLSQKSEMDGLSSVRSEMDGSPIPTYFFEEKKIADPVNELSGSLVEQFELSNPEDLTRPELASAECASRRESSVHGSQWSPATEEHFVDHMVSAAAPPSLWDLKFRPLDHRASGSDTSNSSLSLRQVYERSSASTPGEVAATSIAAELDVAIAPSDPTTINTTQHINYAASSFDNTSELEATFVQDLRNAFFAITVEWRQTLAPKPDLLARCSILSTQTLFETGIVTLCWCFKGVIANTFQEIFAAMVLACASAYMSHYEGYAMNDFFHHMLPWHHALASEDERRLFLRVIDQLVCHQGFSTASSNEHRPSNAQALANLLKNGRIITDCSRFLDDLEYASIQDRNERITPDTLARHSNAHTPGIRWMVKYLTEPLHQHLGIEAFQNVTKDAQRKVGCGLLRSPREVEVALKSTAKHCSRSPEMYEKYHEAVTTYCDLAVQETNSYWRDRYYATAFHKILAISWNIDNRAICMSPFSRPWPDINAFASNRARPPAQELSPASSLSTSSSGCHTNYALADSPNDVYPTIVAGYSTHDTVAKITPYTSSHGFYMNSPQTDRDASSLFETATAQSELDSSPISPTATTSSLTRIPSTSSGSPISPMSPTGFIAITSKSSSSTSLSPSLPLTTSSMLPISPRSLIARSKYTSAPPSRPSSISTTSPTSLINRSEYTFAPSSSPSYSSTTPLPTLTNRPNNPYLPSPPPPPSTSHTSPSRSREKIKCPSCPATFEPIYGARYLERHLKYSKVHGNITAILCSEPGCGSIFGRKDNLDRHLQEKHHGTERLPPGGSRKRKRVEARDVVDGEGGSVGLMGFLR